MEKVGTATTNGFGVGRAKLLGLAQDIRPVSCPAPKIWGQTRCPIYRSGTFNVKLSTLNF